MAGGVRAQPAGPCASAARLSAGEGGAAAFSDSLRTAPVCEDGRDALGRLALVLAAAVDTTALAVASAVSDVGDTAEADTTLPARLRLLRARHPVLVRGALVPLAADSAAGAFAFARRLGADELVVVVNAGDAEARLDLPPALARSALVPILASRGDVAVIPSLLLIFYESGATGHAHPVPPRTAVVFRRAEPADVRPRGLDE